MSLHQPKGLLQKASAFFSGTLLSRISGLLRDLVMAYAFGAGSLVAAFFVAFRLAHLLRRVLGEGAMQPAFIPVFEGLRQEGKAEEKAFFHRLRHSLTWLLIFIVIATELALAFSLSWSLSESTSEIIKLTMWLAPGLIFVCLFGLNASVLQCEGKYFLPGAAPVLFNMVWTVGALAVLGLPEETAIPSLALIVTLGSAAQWLCTVPATKRAIGPYKKAMPFSSAAMRKLCGALGLGIIGIAASQINSGIDTLYARYADLEGPAHLWYAIRIQQLPLGLFGIALSGALLPTLSQALQRHATEEAQQLLTQAIRAVFMVMIPASFLLWACGASGVNLLYGHGRFDTSAVISTTWCLWAYTLGLIPMTLVLIVAPAFYARNDFHTPTRSVVLSVIVNILLNTLLIAGWGYGTASVALATSLSAMINLGSLALGHRSWLLKQLPGSLFYFTAKLTLGSVIASGVAIGCELWVMGDANSLLAWMGQSHLLSRESEQQFYHCAISGGAFALTWAATSLPLCWRHLKS